MSEPEEFLPTRTEDVAREALVKARRECQRAAREARFDGDTERAEFWRIRAHACETQLHVFKQRYPEG